MKLLLPAVLSVLLTTAACTSQPGPGDHVYWVNSLKVPCVGVAPTPCLQVYKGESLDPTEWKFFYSTIEGFEYEPGYVYKLLVNERELDEAEVPADGSSIVYSLVKVLEKEKDKKLVLHEVWMLETLNGKAISEQDNSAHFTGPRLEIHVGEMRYAGTDGCNQIFGGIIEITENILRFGIGAGTRMMCPEMEVPDEFNRTLPQVNSYEVRDLKLHLFDAAGNEVLQFQKTD